MHLKYQLARWHDGFIVSCPGARDYHSGLQAGMLCFLRGAHTVALVSKHSPYLQHFHTGTPQQQSWQPNCSEIPVAKWERAAVLLCSTESVKQGTEQHEYQFS